MHVQYSESYSQRSAGQRQANIATSSAHIVHNIVMLHLHQTYTIYAHGDCFVFFYGLYHRKNRGNAVAMSEKFSEA